MENRFYFFIKRSLDDEIQTEPICTTNFLGGVGDFFEINGVGYIITDYAVEPKNWSEVY